MVSMVSEEVCRTATAEHGIDVYAVSGDGTIRTMSLAKHAAS